MHYIYCMKKTTIVAFLLLFSSQTYCTPLTDSIQKIESAWARIYYQQNSDQQKIYYLKLIKQSKELSQKFPQAVEPKIWHAILLSTNAAYEPPINALSSLNKAKELLEEAINQHPEALEGSAFVTLGTLYYMTPSWPISFGNPQIAERLLKKGLQINPNGIDSNYFYADYLLSQNREDEAEKYFEKASKAPIRKEQFFADTQLQKDAKIALLDAQKRKLDKGKNVFLSLFSSSNY